MLQKLNEKTGLNIRWVDILLAVTITSFIVFALNVFVNWADAQDVDHSFPMEKHDTDTIEIDIKDQVYNAIFRYRLQHPDIVFAQAILESGNMKDKLFTEGNNLFGMKVPSKRPTLAVGVMMGHARFESWEDSVKDYAIWQSIYCRDLSRDEYFAYLDRVYSTNKDYVKILKRIIKRVENVNIREKMSCIEKEILTDTIN